MARFLQSGVHPSTATNFDLAQYHIFFHGVGGTTAAKLKFQEVPKVCQLHPQFVILQVGSNDACDRDKDATLIADAIRALARYLVKELGVLQVVVCQILTRDSVPFPSYNFKIKDINAKLKSILQHEPHCHFWSHRGLWRSKNNIYLRDGVHLNLHGQIKLYRSYRGAMLRQCQVHC